MAQNRINPSGQVAESRSDRTDEETQLVRVDCAGEQKGNEIPRVGISGCGRCDCGDVCVSRGTSRVSGPQLTIDSQKCPKWNQSEHQMDERITRQEAVDRGLSTYFTGKICKNGHLAKRYVQNWTCVTCHSEKSVIFQKKWREQKPEKQKQYALKYADKKRESSKLWRQLNKERCNQNQQAWNAANREQRNLLSKKWRSDNKSSMLALKAKRRSDILKRTPKWLTADDFWLIRQAYDLAKLRTVVTQIDWQVDHVIPLRGKRVSGLHVPSNLRVVPTSVNLRKGNKYAVG